MRDLALGPARARPGKDEFCLRFQQTSGPAIAKGVEDTAGYRWHPLAALGEVGGGPDDFGCRSSSFTRWPSGGGRLAGCDQRAVDPRHQAQRGRAGTARRAQRVPAEWLAAVGWQARWAVGAAPGERGGTEPWSGWRGRPSSAPGRSTPSGSAGYLRKAAREAKLHTLVLAGRRVRGGPGRLRGQVCADDAVLGPGWALRRAAASRLRRERARAAAGAAGGRGRSRPLPGLRGREPAPRRSRQSVTGRPCGRHCCAGPRTGGRARPVHGPRCGQGPAHGDRAAAAPRPPALLGAGAPQVGLPASGSAADHVLAFRRGDDVVAVATRFALRLAGAGGWRDTRLVLPPGRWSRLLTGGQLTADPAGTALGDVLGDWPVALLVRNR